jgi:hypothetical protein
LFNVYVSLSVRCSQTEAILFPKMIQPLNEREKHTSSVATVEKINEIIKVVNDIILYLGVQNGTTIHDKSR